MQAHTKLTGKSKKRIGKSEDKRDREATDGGWSLTSRTLDSISVGIGEASCFTCFEAAGIMAETSAGEAYDCG
jgi:hypothetical protein